MFKNIKERDRSILIEESNLSVNCICVIKATTIETRKQRNPKKESINFLINKMIINKTLNIKPDKKVR